MNRREFLQSIAGVVALPSLGVGIDLLSLIPNRDSETVKSIINGVTFDITGCTYIPPVIDDIQVWNDDEFTKLTGSKSPWYLHIDGKSSGVIDFSDDLVNFELIFSKVAILKGVGSMHSLTKSILPFPMYSIVMYGDNGSVQWCDL